MHICVAFYYLLVKIKSFLKSVFSKKTAVSNSFLSLNIHAAWKDNSYFLRFLIIGSSHGRVVKASDSKADVIFTSWFESCWLQLSMAKISRILTG